MGFLDYRPDLAAGESQNTGNPVLWICTENRNGIICDTIYDGTGFPILIRYRVFAYLYLSKLRTGSPLSKLQQFLHSGEKYEISNAAIDGISKRHSPIIAS